MGVNGLPKTVTRQRRDCDSNPGPSAPESSAPTTRLPSHPICAVLYRYLVHCSCRRSGKFKPTRVRSGTEQNAIGEMKSSICINIDDSSTTLVVPATDGCGGGATGATSTGDRDQHYLVSSTASDGNAVVCQQGRIKHLVGPTHFTKPGPQSLC